MSARTLTLVIVAVVTVLLIVWDIYVVFLNKEKNDSISEWIRDLGAQALIIPFGFGVLMGHWFWPNDAGALFGQGPSAILLGALGIVAALIQLLIPKIKTFKYRQIALVALGTFGGHFLWPLG